MAPDTLGPDDTIYVRGHPYRVFGPKIEAGEGLSPPHPSKIDLEEEKNRQFRQFSRDFDLSGASGPVPSHLGAQLHNLREGAPLSMR